jgi:hypothetical protein
VLVVGVSTVTAGAPCASQAPSRCGCAQIQRPCFMGPPGRLKRIKESVSLRKEFCSGSGANRPSCRRRSSSTPWTFSTVVLLSGAGVDLVPKPTERWTTQVRVRSRPKPPATATCHRQLDRAADVDAARCGAPWAGPAPREGGGRAACACPSAPRRRVPPWPVSPLSTVVSDSSAALADHR